MSAFMLIFTAPRQRNRPRLLGAPVAAWVISDGGAAPAARRAPGPVDMARVIVASRIARERAQALARQRSDARTIGAVKVLIYLYAATVAGWLMFG
jgi:hypothetical protein